MQKLGQYPNLYAQVEFWIFFFMDRHYIFLFLFFETHWKMSQYLIKSLPYNSWITLNGFWYKETDKGAQKSDKNKPKSL